MSAEPALEALQAPEQAEIGLEHLPADELARIMTFLRLEDVQNLQLTSKSLRRECQDERVWYSMCDTSWSKATDIREWLERADKSPAPQNRPSSSSSSSPFPRRHLVPAPASFQQLFYYLRHIERLCGLWRVIGEGPVGALISFSWTNDGLEGEEVSYSSLRKKVPDKVPYLRICPRRGLDVEVEWGEDDSTVTLKVHPSGASERLMRRSSSAEAAAAVAYGTPQSSSMLGTSPEGSFEHAWLEFMSSNVAKSSKSRRKSSRGVGPAAQVPQLHHLRKVDPPKPSARHPLAGLWIGDYGPAGIQVLRVAYDFTGRAARVIADKVTGDDGVAAGQRSWWALAAAIPQPWPAEELALLEELQRLEEEAAEDGALQGLEALFLEEDETSSSGGSESAEEYQENGQNGEKRVVAVHLGAGQVAVGEGQPREWTEGRLLVMSDGSLKFWWLEDIRQSVALRRVDAEIVCICPARTS